MSNFTPLQLKEINFKTVKSKTISLLIDKILDLLIPKTNSFCKLQVTKHPDNHQMDQIEVKDVVTGFNDQKDYVVAQFDGGDTSNWQNYTILSNLTLN